MFVWTLVLLFVLFPGGIVFGLSIAKSQGRKPPQPGTGKTEPKPEAKPVANTKEKPIEQRGWVVVAFGNADNIDPYFERPDGCKEESTSAYFRRTNAARMQWLSEMKLPPDHLVAVTFHDNLVHTRRCVIVPFKALPFVSSLHGSNIVILGNANTGQCIIATGMTEHDNTWFNLTRATENIRFLNEEPGGLPLLPE